MIVLSTMSSEYLNGACGPCSCADIKLAWSTKVLIFSLAKRITYYSGALTSIIPDMIDSICGATMIGLANLCVGTHIERKQLLLESCLVIG